MTIGERIKQKRIERGLSQRAMARELGVANMVLCWWEKDHNLPSLLSLWDLADYFGCSMDELCGRTFVPTNNELVPKENELPSVLTNEDKVSEKDKLLLINENKSNNFDVKSNKQIEEMAKTIDDNIHYYSVFGKPTMVSVVEIAKILYNAGYRKQSEVIDEFAEKLKEAPIKCGLPLFGLSTKEEIEEYFNDIMLQVRDAIDNIAKEMKGGE